MQSELDLAIMAIKDGDTSTAYRLLLDIINRNPQSEQAEMAWIWMSSIVRSNDEKRKCLVNVLNINPRNEHALIGLTKLTRQSSTQSIRTTAEQPAVERQIPIFPDVQPRTQVTRYSEADRSAQETQEEISTRAKLIDTDDLSWLGFSLFPLHTAQIIGFMGCLILVIGVFAPLVRLPLIGSINYFRNGTGDGVLILALVAVSLILLLFREYRWLWITGLTSLGIISYAFISIITTIFKARDALESELSEDIFSELANVLMEVVQVEWGWIALFFGTGLILFAANAKVRADEGIPWIHATIGLVLFLIILAALIFVREGSFITSPIP